MLVAAVGPVDEAAQMLAAASALPQLGVGIPRRCHRSRPTVLGEMHDDTVRSLMRGLSSGSAAAGRLVGDADRAEGFTSCGVRGVRSLRVTATGWGTRLRKQETECEQR